jgi:glycosyltransferase involved in cell wall biosynthesis
MGRKVLYVENTGVRPPRLSDARRVAARLGRWGQSVGGGGRREISPNVWLSSPLMLPPFGPAWQRALNRRVFVPRLREAARALGIDRAQIWTFLPTDTALDVIDSFGPSCAGVIYDCGADFSQLTPRRGRLEDSERALVQRSDVVFTNCARLARRFEPWHRRVRVMPGGVSLEAFPLEAPPGSGVPPELQALPHPIVGYVGGLHRHLALDLLVALARARPQWSWVYVGPRQTDVGALAGQANVHLVGARPHDQLAGYIRRFDACTIPYARSVYTDTVVPTKLNEYLALGKPVVSTDLPALADAPEVLSAIWTAPAVAAPFLAAIEAALAAPTTATVAQRRRQLAASADWNVRLLQMLEAAAPPGSR